MNELRNKNTSPPDKDGEGVRIIEHGGGGGGGGSRSALLYKLLALVLVVCFAAYLINMAIHRLLQKNASAHSDVVNSLQPESAQENTNALGGSSVVARPATIHSQAIGLSRDANDLSYYVAPGQAPKMGEVIERLHEAGIYSGLGAFNPPGTSPPMVGLAVPEDYVLPEGYVRHFQATDDGQRIEPILMYSPDFEFFDSAGQPITIPDNRVVPGAMAPPGLVIRPIEIPDPLEPGGP
jgi:hypothetical protein